MVDIVVTTDSLTLPSYCLVCCEEDMSKLRSIQCTHECEQVWVLCDVCFEKNKQFRGTDCLVCRDNNVGVRNEVVDSCDDRIFCISYGLFLLSIVGMWIIGQS